jgi:hypothetical protein
MTGCASSGYLIDRGRDAADIFTVAFGVGAGAKARVGPITAGMFVNSDVAGLRGGEAFALTEDFARTPYEATVILPVPPIFWEDYVPLFVTDEFRASAQQGSRHKSYHGTSYVPLVAWVDDPSNASTRWAYNTQIEVAGGLGLTVRLGFNPLELLDFIIGWTTLDILDDDIGVKGFRRR